MAGLELAWVAYGRNTTPVGAAGHSPAAIWLPDGHVVAAYEEAAPQIVAAARVLAEMGLYSEAAAGAPIAGSYDRAASTLLGRTNLRPG